MILDTIPILGFSSVVSAHVRARWLTMLQPITVQIEYCHSIRPHCLLPFDGHSITWGWVIPPSPPPPRVLVLLSFPSLPGFRRRGAHSRTCPTFGGPSVTSVRETRV